MISLPSRLLTASIRCPGPAPAASISRRWFTALAAAAGLFAALPAARAQITAQITDPPENISLVAGRPVQFAASIRNPDATAAQVQFIFNGTPLLQFPLNGPYVRSFTLPSRPGSYRLVLNVTDLDGNLTTDERTVTVVAADEVNDPLPEAGLLTDLTGRTIHSGATIVLTGTAQSQNTNGQRLGRVDFYTDNTIIASYDGSGNPVATAATAARGAFHTSAVNDNGDAANGLVYSGTWTVPETEGLVNLAVVATTMTGRSFVSGIVPVRVTTDDTNQAPDVAILSVTSGEQFPINTAINIPVTASDPDRAAGPTRPASQLASVANYINSSRISTPLTSPYGFPYALTAVGTFVINSIATDGLGLSTVAVPVIFRVVGPTAVTLVKPANRDVSEGAGPRRVRVVRTGDLTQSLTVTYRTAGGAREGVDYAPLTGTVTFPRGISRARIKVRALSDGAADGDKTLKLILTNDANAAYNVGTPRRVNLRIIDTN